MYKILIILEQRYLTEYDCDFCKIECDKLAQEMGTQDKILRKIPWKEYEKRQIPLEEIRKLRKQRNELLEKARNTIALFGSKTKAEIGIKHFIAHNNLVYSKCDLCPQRTKL